MFPQNFRGGGYNKGVCSGVVFGKDHKIEHALAYTKEQRDSFRGSKYVQSDIGNIYNKISREIQSGNLVLFTGTPCQVAGLRTYLAGLRLNDKFLITNDVVCHGVPSPRLWKDYIEFLQKKYKSKLTKFNFRDKNIGWRGYNIRAEFENGVVAGNGKITRVFTNLFLKDVMLRPSCYYCPYAQLGRCSDITIGDFWGIEKIIPNFSDNEGISMVFLNTDKGCIIFDSCNDSLKVDKCSTKKLTQHNLYAPSNYGEAYDTFWKDYFNKGFLKVAKKYGGYGVVSKVYYYREAIRFKLRNLNR